MSEHEASTENELFPSRVTVGEYREIFIWPFHLVTEQGNSSESQFTHCVHELKKSPWGRPLPMLSTEDKLSPKTWSPLDKEAPTYEEIVYFHPHVRDFLYGTDTSGDDKKARSILRFSRDDLQTVDVQITNDNTPPISLSVVRAELYLAKPLMGLLVLEVYQNNSSPLGREINFNDVLDLQQKLRQIYPPYFPLQKEEDLPIEGMVGGHCPYQVIFQFEQKAIPSNFVDSKREFVTETYQSGEPPVANHWRSLLAPFEPYAGKKDGKIRYQQFVDDRIPSMTFLSVDNPFAIADGDFFRLAYCDDPGDDEYFFSQSFLEENNSDIYYDRFWDKSRKNRKQNTRYLSTGFHFIVVGDANEWYFRELVSEHFRRHYFRIGLILHYQRAALLKFSDELAHAIKRCHGKHPDTELDSERFRQDIRALQLGFTKFASRGWFPEVSNQLQARELFDLWSRNLRMQPLYDHVSRRAESLYNAMTEHESRRLTKLAYYLIPPTLVLAVLALPVEDGFWSWPAKLSNSAGVSNLTGAQHLGASLLAITILALLSIPAVMLSLNILERIGKWWRKNVAETWP